MRTPNIELLDRVVARIESDPAHWDQSVYGENRGACGSSFCVAGWAAVLSGAVRFVPTRLDRTGKWVPTTKNRADDWEFWDDAKKCVVDAHQVGREQLGLDRGVANELFMGENSWEEILEMVAAIREQALETAP